MEITQLTIEPLRSAFPHEAQHLTTWLEQNPEALSKRLGIVLADPQREVRVGDFNVDLLCTDAQGHQVVIENQLERTDHDHLGKLLVYMVNLDAKTAVWISPEPRVEHIKVVSWLNETTPADLSFYLVKVEAVRIGHSAFAPLFSVLVGPDAQAKKIGEKNKELAERHHLRLKFWEGLIEVCKTSGNRFANRAVGTESWIGVGSGLSGCGFNFVILYDKARVELYIDHDHDTGELNKKLFDILMARKMNLEQSFGAPLAWERLDGKRASRISYTVGNEGLANESAWPELQQQMAERMECLDKVLRPEIESAKKSLRLKANSE